MNSTLHKKSPFIGEKVLLRAIELTDVPLMMKHWNTYETRIGLGVFIPDSSLQREEWVKEITEKGKKGESFIFAIINKKTNDFLGVCSLTKVNKVNRGAFMGVAIYNPEDHNKGFGTDAVTCLLKIGFDILNLHRIELHVYEFLESAIHIYKKLGFKEVGIRREASFIAGEYRNDIVMDILEYEFKEIYD
ncbi:MAG: GNAT family N-acetyltransferase [Candidatus Thorarchaeota archaeon]